MRWLRMGIVIALFSLLLGSLVTEAQTTLVFQYRTGDAARQQAVEAWIAEFEAEHPDIKIEVLPAGSDYRDRTILSWATGQGPDVTEIWGEWAQDYARAGVLLDLRPYVERDFTPEDIADFWPASWEASMLRYGEHAGIQFLIPRYMISLVYYYNTGHFEEAGLADPAALDARGEWTYAALRDLALKLTQRSGDQVLRYGFTTDSDAFRRLVVWMRAFGGELFSPEDPTVFTGASGPAVEAMTFLQEMIWQDESTLPQFNPGAFYDGGVSIVEEGNHAVLSRFEFNIAGRFAWDIAPAPRGPNGRKAYAGDDGFAIWKDTPNPDAAWKFVKFLTSKRGQEIAAIHEGLAPVRRSALPVYAELAPHINLAAYMVNMEDAGAPIAGLMLGDVAEISRILTNVLDRTMELNEVEYARAIQEVAPTISELTRR